MIGNEQEYGDLATGGVWDSPLPHVDRTPLVDPRVWRAAQAVCAAPLAEAALAVGRLDAMLADMSDAARTGAIRRLALTEVEAMLWAQGMPLRREEIGRDLMDARADSDLQAMRLARWALRRLEGSADTDDLRSFLGLHRSDRAELTEMPTRRPLGQDLDDAIQGFHDLAARLGDLHPFCAAPALRTLWRLSDLSPPDTPCEAAVWTARRMASGCEALTFLPMGRHGRQVWTDSGEVETRLIQHLAALAAGAGEARRHLLGLRAWADEARRRTESIKGRNPGRVIAALAAHPLMTTAMVEEAAGISRDTAERLLARMHDMGLLREVTGTRRFRLWTAAT